MQTEIVVGKIHRVNFQNPDDGYTIIDVKTPAEGYKTVKGYNLPNTRNILFRFMGHQVNKTGNRYFHADTFEDAGKEKIETNKDIIEYISSDLFPGIGLKTALLIVDKFGDNAIDVIENETSTLASIKGISASKISNLKKAIEDNRYLQIFTKEMMHFGITASQCAKLAVLYGKEVKERIHSNPYCLVRDLRLDFRTVDGIAGEFGIAKDADIRIDSAFIHIINQNYTKGHTGIELQMFGKETKSLLGPEVSEEKISARCLAHVQSGSYKCVTLDTNGNLSKYIFTNNMFIKEKDICDNVVRLRQNEIKLIKDVRNKIKEIEEQKGITLDSLQILAIEASLESPFTVITGGPGTGKTTIMEFIVSIYEKETKKEAILLAPTGKAARKLAESTGHLAKTIHSQFNVYDLEADIDTLSIEDIKETLVICDEVSMLDVNTCHLLLTRIREGSRVVFVGDQDQLPSVGAGAVLRDIINSQICATIRLDRIFRTEAESLIYSNTQKVNRGIKDLKQGDDFHMYRESDVEKCKALMTDLYIKRVAEYGIEETILLLPYKKGCLGVLEMNKHLQAIINPPTDSKSEVRIGEKVYRVGDMVINLSNNQEEKLSNGDVGIIKKTLDIDGVIQVIVSINGTLHTYDNNNLKLENLELSYATTVHKSQGSEYQSVILGICEAYQTLLFRNIVYVGLSRAKKQLDLLYDEGLFKAIDTPMTNSRITLLFYLLKRASSHGKVIYDIY